MSGFLCASESGGLCRKNVQFHSLYFGLRPWALGTIRENDIIDKSGGNESSEERMQRPLGMRWGAQSRTATLYQKSEPAVMILASD